MTIISHSDQRQTKNYLSKLTGRPIMNPSLGSTNTVLWEQHMPAGGFVASHCHEDEEILTILTGEAEVTIDGETFSAQADATILFKPGVVHSLRNVGSDSVHMLSYHPTADPKFIYTRESFGEAWNSNSRMLLDQHYKASDQTWNSWLFDQIDTSDSAKVLDLGCGSGDLWAENEERVPPGWEMLLSDFSPTMLNNARRNLRHTEANVSFELFNANAIPIDNNAFDVVIANHLLFYMADWENGIQEIARVLKPGGKLYASTTGENHLKELNELVTDFDAEADFWGIPPAEPFYLESGSEQIARHFSQVETRQFDDHLEVGEADPLVDFVLSTNAKSRLVGEQLIAFMDHVESRIQSVGKIRITKDEGLFVARL